MDQNSSDKFSRLESFLKKKKNWSIDELMRFKEDVSEA